MQENNWTYIHVTLCKSTVQYIVLYSSSVYPISVTSRPLQNISFRLFIVVTFNVQFK